MSLDGKRVVLVGGTSGIGFATAEAAAREGAAVVVVSSRAERVEAAVARLGGDATGRAVDMTDEVGVRAFFGEVGAFDHLVYTAGESLQLGPIAGTELAVAKEYFGVRYWGAFQAAKYGAPGIRPGGSIVMSSGIAGARPRAGWALGASLCGAMEALTRALAVELAPIRVNAVCPGVVRTELWGNMAEGEREAMYRNVGAALPVGRVGEPGDLAQAYLYLMREGFSTGHVLVVDGGAVLV